MPRADKAKSTGRRKPRPSRKPPVERGPDVPHWLPAGTCWERLPENVREAVSRFVAPAYRRFVLDAPSEIEVSIGTTLVHLMWLELCGQLQLAQAAADPFRAEVTRLLALETQNGNVVAARQQKALQKKKLLEQALFNLRRLRGSYAPPPRPALNSCS